MKCSWPGTCIKMFWPYLPRGGSRARQNRSRGRWWFPFFKKTSSSDWKATATNQIHSNDLEGCVMQCSCFWFHSVVKFLTLESSLYQKCSLYSGERSVPLGALVCNNNKAENVHMCYFLYLYNPEFENHILDIYPAELQLNKANISDKESSFLDLNIKVISSDIHTSVYDKRDDFGFPIVNFSWLSGDVPRLPSYGIYISQLVRFARCCASVLDFHSKNLQITTKLLTQGY